MSPRFPAFLILAVLILGGPVYGHFFATGSHRYIGWKMFSRKATDFCAVEYWRVVDGASVPVDRFEVLGNRSRRLVRIRDAKTAARYGRSMCRKLGRGTDLRMRVRCATPKRWAAPVGEETKLCR